MATRFLAALCVLLPLHERALSCTSLLVTPGASADGSTLVTYTADSYGMFGRLEVTPGGSHERGSRRAIADWETGVARGSIAEAPRTHGVVGYVNERQVALAETTYGGRPEMVDSTGLMDYGSLMRVALERASTAREAIGVMTSLAEEHGYASEGETFSVADPREAWLLEMQGCGPGSRGVVWVAVRVPDGCISGHANQSRIGPFHHLEHLASANVVSYARGRGWYNGPDEAFSWKAAYAPPDFEGRRLCDARVWSFFNHHADASPYLPWALGRDTEAADLPLWVKPTRPIALNDLLNDLRDHYEGTPLSMTDTTGLAGGPWLAPYRPTPLTFDLDGRTYTHERPISTQQTAFCFAAQLRATLPDHLGGVLWYANDDANMVCFTPVGCQARRAPRPYDTPGADAATFRADNAFWLCNLVSNMVYPRYSALMPELAAVRDSLQEGLLAERLALEARLTRARRVEAQATITAAGEDAAERMMKAWSALALRLIVRHNDQCVKALDDAGQYVLTPHRRGATVERPGYPEATRRRLAETGSVVAEPQR